MLLLLFLLCIFLGNYVYLECMSIYLVLFFYGIIELEVYIQYIQKNILLLYGTYMLGPCLSLGGPLYIIPYHIIYSTFMSIAVAHYVLTHSVSHHH